MPMKRGGGMTRIGLIAVCSGFAASQAAALIKQLKETAHLAISGRTMEFDGKGKCVAGC